MPPSRSHLRQGELRGGRWIFQARSSGIWPRSSVSRGCCCQTKSCGSRAAETEKQGKDVAPSSRSQLHWDELFGGQIFMHIHPVFGRTPLSPAAAAAKYNLMEAEQQRRRSGGRCRSAQQKPSPPRRAARQALDCSCAFIRHLAALLSRQRLLLPDKIS